MNTEELAEWLKPKLGGANVKHILNWGGFVNHSFHVADGPAKYHLKLTPTVNMNRFDSWLRTHDVLESRYHAPTLIDRMDFPEIGFSGLMFRHVDGTTADLCNQHDLLQTLIATADRLHHDDEIRSVLGTLSEPKTCFDYFVETYIDRFTSDLSAIGANLPPFISSSLFDWMQHETRALQSAASQRTSLHHPATEPVHGDLHEGNILVSESDWHILDWDDLTLGDAALDFAIVIWPIVYKAGRHWQEFMPSADAAFSDRMEICFKAQLLDEVIDTLADYIEAETVPSNRTQVQLMKKSQHEQALKRYRLKYGS